MTFELFFGDTFQLPQTFCSYRSAHFASLHIRETLKIVDPFLKSLACSQCSAVCLLRRDPSWLPKDKVSNLSLKSDHYNTCHTLDLDISTSLLACQNPERLPFPCSQGLKLVAGKLCKILIQRPSRKWLGPVSSAYMPLSSLDELYVYPLIITCLPKIVNNVV